MWCFSIDLPLSAILTPPAPAGEIRLQSSFCWCVALALIDPCLSQLGRSGVTRWCRSTSGAASSSSPQACFLIPASRTFDQDIQDGLTADMEASTKTPHFKSRNGCLRCKAKKVILIPIASRDSSFSATANEVRQPDRQNATRKSQPAPAVKIVASSVPATHSTCDGRKSIKLVPTRWPQRRHSRVRYQSTMRQPLWQIWAGAISPLPHQRPPSRRRVKLYSNSKLG